MFDGNETMTKPHIFYFILLALFFSALSYQNHLAVSQIEHRLSSIEMNQKSISNSIQQEPERHTINETTENFKLSENKISTENQVVANTKTDTQDRNTLDHHDNSHSNSDAVLTLIDDINNTGYLNNEMWADIDDEIQSMTREENKIFWENMTNLIEQNQVDIYLGQE